MALRRWLGTAPVVQQSAAYTPGGTIAVGSTFTLATPNGKSVTFTAATTVAADAAAGLATAFQASNEPEFRELSAVAPPGGSAVVVTGPADGTSYTLTPTAGGSGSPTLTAGSAVAPGGPSWWSVATNWSGAAVPVTGDDVVFDDTSTVDCLYGLNQNTVSLVNLTVTAGYTGRIGLPARNDAGYAEYRDQYLRIGATGDVLIGEGEGGGPALVRLDTGGVATDLTVFAGVVHWKGTHATGNVLYRSGGTLNVAAVAGDVATVYSLDVIDAGGSAQRFTGGGTAPDVDLGAGAAVATLTTSGGSVRAAGTLTDVSVADGTLKLAGHATASGSIVVLPGGTLKLETDGALNDLDVSGTLDCSGDARSRPVATLVVRPGYSVIDPDRTMIIATPIEMVGCGLEGMNLGRQFRITPAELP